MSSANTDWLQFDNIMNNVHGIRWNNNERKILYQAIKLDNPGLYPNLSNIVIKDQEAEPCIEFYDYMMRARAYNCYPKAVTRLRTPIQHGYFIDMCYRYTRELKFNKQLTRADASICYCLTSEFIYSYPKMDICTFYHRLYQFATICKIYSKFTIHYKNTKAFNEFLNKIYEIFKRSDQRFIYLFNGLVDYSLNDELVPKDVAYDQYFNNIYEILIKPVLTNSETMVRDVLHSTYPSNRESRVLQSKDYKNKVYDLLMRGDVNFALIYHSSIVVYQRGYYNENLFIKYLHEKYAYEDDDRNNMIHVYDKLLHALHNDQSTHLIKDIIDDIMRESPNYFSSDNFIVTILDLDLSHYNRSLDPKFKERNSNTAILILENMVERAPLRYSTYNSYRCDITAQKLFTVKYRIKNIDTYYWIGGYTKQHLLHKNLLLIDQIKSDTQYHFHLLSTDIIQLIYPYINDNLPVHLLQ